MDDLEVLRSTVSRVLHETEDLREASRVTYQLIGMTGRVQFKTFCKIVNMDMNDFTALLNELSDIGGGGYILQRLEKLGVLTSEYFDENGDPDNSGPDLGEPKDYGFTTTGALYFYHMFMSPARDMKNIPIYSLLKTL